jgi:hypothetical protein
MPSESQVLQSFDVQEPELDDETDIATDAAERSQGKVPEDSDTHELDDGSAILTLHDNREVAKAKEFYVNLAEDMPPDELRGIAVKLLDLFDKDVQARDLRDRQYEEGLKRTGFANDAPGGASFDGASKVVHPLVAEVAIDFSARAIKELWPAGGPVKDKIIGEPDTKKEEKAKRKVRYMNWQMTEQMPSMRYELEQILTQVPMGGVQYSKMWWDVKRKTPVHEPVWVDEIVLPFAATDFYSSPRKAHIQKLDEYTFQDRVRKGIYRDVDTIAIVTQPDETRAEKANNKIEGKSQTNYNEDGQRVVIEFAVQYVLTDEARGVDSLDDDADDEGPAPYLISVDKETRDVLSIYRNWDEDDENMDALVHIVEWPFLPWRGAMPIGAPQVLGGIAAAATGSLRALLDSALINNFPGGVRLKSGPVGGQSVRVEAGQTNEIDGGIMQDDIRKTFMPTPVNPTSAVLFQLLEFLVQSGKEVVKTTLDEANDNANVPVGTIMARIEQQMVVFSAIHSRLHNSMGKLLKVLHRLNATYLEDEDVVKQTGEAMTFKADFDAPDDVIPVSDPEIFSELQRISQVQTIAQRAQLFPQLYDQRKVENTILKMMKITNPEQYLLPKPEPKPLNAVNENIAASLGQPIVAFPDQDHLAHIQSHLGFLEDPLFGANPLMAGTAIGPILQNVKEHMLFWYGTQIHKVASDAAGQDISQFMTIKDAEVQTKFDGMLAAATNVVHAQAQQFFGGLPPVIQKAQAMLQKFQQPPPMDPSAVAQQKIQSDEKMAQAKLQQQAQTDAQTAALKNAEIALEGKTQEAQMTADQQSDQLDAQNNQMDNHTKLQVAGANNQTKQQTVQAQNATKLTVTAEDNTTAETIAGAEMAAGKHTNIKDGTAVGKKPTEG